MLTLHVYHYVAIIAIVLLIRYCIKWILDVRFQLRIGHLGFLSAHNISYGQDMNRSSRSWSIGIGNIRLRIKGSRSQPSSAWITILIDDISLTMDIDRFSFASSKQRTSHTQPWAHVGESLRQPWWYSLWIVKSVLNLLSAFPAQFIMSGLANYVDAEISNLRVDSGVYGSVQLEFVHVSSGFFTMLKRPSPSKNTRDNDNPASLRQRHSLRRADHLFRQKCFDVIVNVGPAHSDDNVLTLPDGAQLIVVCNFSAGCVSVKDLDITANLHSATIDLGQLDKRRQMWALKKQQHANTSVMTGSPKKSKKSMRPLLKSVQLSFVDTTLVYTRNNTTLSILTRKSLLAMSIAQSKYHGSFMLEHQECMLMDTLSKKDRRKLHFFTLSGLSIDLDLTPLEAPEPSRHDNACLLESKARRWTSQIKVEKPRLAAHDHYLALWKQLFFQMSTSKSPTQKSTRESVYLPPIKLDVVIASPIVDIYLSEHFERVSSLDIQLLTMHASGDYLIKNDHLFPDDHDSAMNGHNVSSAVNHESVKNPKPYWSSLFRRNWRKYPTYSWFSSDDSIEWIYATQMSCHFEHTRARIIPYQTNITPVDILSIQQIDIRGCVPLVVDKSKLGCVLTSTTAQKLHPIVQVSIERPTLELSRTLHLDHIIELWISSKPVPTSTSYPTSIPIPTHENLEASSLQEKTLPRKCEWMGRLMSHVKITHLNLVIHATDPGLRDKRDYPQGLFDNAPKHNVSTRATLLIRKVTGIYTGTKVEPWQSNTHTGLSHVTDSDTRSTTHNLVPEEEGHIGLLECTTTLIEIKLSTQTKGDKGKNVCEETIFFWMPKMSLETRIQCSADVLHIDPRVDFHGIGFHYSIRHHYIALLTANFLHGIWQPWHANSAHIEPPPPSPSSLHINLSLITNRMSIYLEVGPKTPLCLNISTIQAIDVLSPQRSFSIDALALLGVSPSDESKWDTLIQGEHLKLTQEKVKDPSANGPVLFYWISLQKLLLRVPYQYIVADIADNFVNFAKCEKLLRPRLKGLLPFTSIWPSSMPTPIAVPSLRITCNATSLLFDDDPFEAKLGVIWRTGLAEQENRMAYEDAFDAKAQTMMQPSAERIASHNIRRKFFGEGNVFGFQVEDPLSEEKTRVYDAWQRLQEHHAKRWMKNINTTIQTQSQHCHDKNHWSTVFQEPPDNIDMKIPYEFSIQAKPLPHQPPLFDVTVSDLTLNIDQPSFPLDDTWKFMHDVGNGVPYSTIFTLLLPFRLTISAGETLAQIRNYPTPLLHIPANESVNHETMSSVAWSLSGDYVLGDEMGEQDATRKVRVAITDMYTVVLGRTTSPPKFYSKVDVQVQSQGMTMACWCIAYQPALTDISRTLESFTRPPVDPSAKIGFWDKIRLVIHTRTLISFTGSGEFALVMKGSRDPCDVSERSFGLAKLWRGNVRCEIGYENPQEECVQISSDQYMFGVPNLALPEYGVQCLSETLGTNDHATTTTKTENNPRFLKVALKLSRGIRMGIGCHLERTCVPGCDKCGNARQCRHFTFRPHYTIKFKSPKAVKALGDRAGDYDAYAGFRSDYIHLSISIIKLPERDGKNKEEATNSMHLTIGFIDHFISWFRLFGGALSYPMRNGPLFPKDDDRPTQKFGRHMRSMKYRVNIDPICIGYFCKDENMVEEEQSVHYTGDSVGLKALVGTFCVDIHQCREVINVKNHKLDQRRLKANWPVQEAEIQLYDIDIRSVIATYHEDGTSLAESKSSLSNSIDLDDYRYDMEPTVTDDLSGFGWIDYDDFVHLHMSIPDTKPSVHVSPFACSPCIYYIKRKKQGNDNPDERQTHQCIMGTSLGTRKMQIQLLQKRCESIDIQIRKHQAHLGRLLDENENERYSRAIQDESRVIVEKTEILFEKRNLLQQYLRELSFQDTTAPTMHRDTGQRNFAYSDSTIFGQDSLARWEEVFGFFKSRYIVHNPQIIWNNQVRNIVYRLLDLRTHRRTLSYYLSSRAMKFLRDLVDTHSPKNEALAFEEDHAGLDDNTTKLLIDKLLSEKDEHPYALNEMEEEDYGIPGAGSDGPTSETANDPHAQLKSVPPGYEMKPSYVIDLLNPQISFQSDQDPNNLVLVSSERTQVKNLSILDSHDPDAETELVKHRTIASIEKTQIFVAKKEHFDSVDLLLDNHYGVKETDKWLAWVPPEMLIHYVYRSDQFQRVGDRMAATIQMEKYNPLRIKANISKANHLHPFVERCDTVHLNFPQLALSANSEQYNAIYEVMMDLLLYKEPAKKDRRERLREIVMAAGGVNLKDIAKNTASLQRKVRNWEIAVEYYHQNLASLDERQREAYINTRRVLYESREELYLGIEAIKIMQSFRRKDYDESKTILNFIFSAQKILFEMLAEKNTPLCEWNVANTTFNLVSKDDRSSINTLEVDTLKVVNKSSSPVFSDVLGPFVDSSRPVDFSRHKMLRCYFVSLAPVGGIPVVQHLEINLSPLRLQMTFEFGMALAAYVFPPSKQAQRHGDILGAPRPGTPASLAPSGSGSTLGSESPKDHHRQASGSDTRPTTFESIGLSEENPRVSEMPSTRSGYDVSSDTPLSTRRRLAAKSKGQKQGTEDDLVVMKERASTNHTFILIKIPGTKHCLSYQGQKEKNIEDLRDFAFQQPNLEYRNRTWSWYELMTHVRKDFLRAALLNNSTALLKEKLLIRRHHKDQELSSSATDDASSHDNSAIRTSTLTLMSEDSQDQSEVQSFHSVSVAGSDMSTSSKTNRFLASWRRLKGLHRSDPQLRIPRRISESGIEDTQDESDRSLVSTMEGGSVTLENMASRGRVLFGKSYNGPTRGVGPPPHPSSST